MSESTPPATAHTPHPAGRRFGRILVRIYACLILLIVCWTGYTAIAYLARYVFMAGRVPPQFMDTLAAGPASAPSAVQDGSGPVKTALLPEPSLKHYHRDTTGLTFAGSPGCTTSGCHTLLPHAKRKEVRAFANFHSTFLDCSACHDARVQAPTAAVWLDNRTGEKRETPALLRLMTTLEVDAPELQSKPAQIGPRIVEWLAQAETDVGVDPALREIRVQLETSEPGSPVWRAAADELQLLLPNRIRGEYGAKLAPTVAADQWLEHNQRLSELSAQFHASTAGSARRTQLHQQIHENILPNPGACLSCHGDQPARFDFGKLGYSAERTASLQSMPVARMVQQIRDGHPFHLPELLSPNDAK